MAIVYRSGHFDFDPDALTRDTGLECKDATKAQQQFAADADINVIVKRFNLTGELPASYRPPLMDDFVDIFDYQTALNAIRRADELFMQVPADLRARFSNDPQAFIEFCSDSKNLDEMRKLGLALPLKEEPPKAAPTPDATAKA